MAEMITIPYARQQAYRNPQYVAAMADLLMRRGEQAAAARMMRGQNTQRLMGDLGQMTMATFAGIGQQRDEERDRAILQAERDREHQMKLAEMEERRAERDRDEKWRRDQFRESRGKEFAAGTDVGARVSPGDYRRMVEGTASAGRFDYEPAQAQRLPARPMSDMMGLGGYSDAEGITDFARMRRPSMSADTSATPEQYVRTPDAGESLAIQNLERQEQALALSAYNTQLDNERAVAQMRQTQANANRTFDEDVRQFGITEARLRARDAKDTQLTAGANFGLQGDEFLSQLPPQLQTLVKSIADYKADITKVTSLRGDQRQKVAELVMQYDPSFDMSMYPTRVALRRDFTTGKVALNARQLNTAVGHLNDLSTAAEGLKNTDWQILNKGKNWVLTQSGDPRVVSFQTKANAVEGELAAVFKGMGATDQEIAAWREVVGSNLSPGQLQAFITGAIELMGSRLGALRHQYEVGMGKPKDFDLLSGTTRRTLKRLGFDPETMEPQSTPDEATVYDPKAGLGGSGGTDFFSRLRGSGARAPITFGPPQAPVGPPPVPTGDPFTRPGGPPAGGDFRFRPGGGG